MNIVGEGFNALVIHGLKQIVDGPAFGLVDSFAAILQPAMEHLYEFVVWADHWHIFGVNIAVSLRI